MERLLKIIKTLSEAIGVSGNEEEVRRIMIEYLRPHVDEVRIDKLGNLIAIKKGKIDAPRIMLAAHMDEIGLVVKFIDDKGFIKFARVGGIHFSTLVNRRIVVHTENGPVRGVIGIRPPLLQKEIDEKDLDLFVDVGASTKKDVESMGICIGDYITFDQHFEELGAPNIITGKALDNRIGCAVLVETVRRLKDSDCTIFAVGTVQEEVGLKGARVAAYGLKPTLAIALDVAVSADFPGVKLHEAPVKVGEGPVIILMEAGGRGTITHKAVKHLLVDAGKAKKLPYQLKVSEGGQTDAAMIYLSREGIPSGVLSVASRYIHSPIEVASLKDMKDTVTLLVEAVNAVPANIEFASEPSVVLR